MVWLVVVWAGIAVELSLHRLVRPAGDGTSGHLLKGHRLVRMPGLEECHQLFEETADADLIPKLEDGRALDALAVDPGAVGRAKVFEDPGAVIIGKELAVAAADGVVSQRKLS